jgi:DnaJ-domain-containing protein 1
MLNLSDIPALHDQLTARWHQEAFEIWRPSTDIWTSLVARQHLANFELWHTEDEARSPGAADADLARVKRRIDEINQRRNDLAEQIDRALLHALAGQGLPRVEAPLHSESPGLIVDRLSILSLKLFHTREEVERASAPEGHAARNRERLTILVEQRSDLAQCLVHLWEETLTGQRRFKLYRQLKMYNDPALNPAVYRGSAKA